MAFSGRVATFADPNLADGDPGHPASYSASIDWGDGTKSAGLVAAAGGVSFDVSGSHAYALDGAYLVTITLSGPGTSSPLPAPSATVLHGIASIGLPGMFPSPIPVIVTLDGEAPPLGSVDPTAAATGAGMPSPTAEIPSPVPAAFVGPAAITIQTAAPSSSALAPTPVLVSIAAPALATTPPNVVVASSRSTPPSVSGPVPLPEATAPSSATAATPGRRASIIAANSSLRPVASALASKSTIRRPRRQVARAKPAGPRAAPARPGPQAMATPEVRSIAPR